MKLDKTDVLVAVFFTAALMATVGMLFDIWQAVYYSIPVFSLLFMLMGSLNARDQWSRRALAPVVVFSLLMAGLFLAAGALIDSSASFGGLPATTAIFVYIVWPISAVGGPLVYAMVYESWLAKDIPASQPN